jgi:sulfate adenylyltransferase (ADP) / ATP adenylyltransferase
MSKFQLRYCPALAVKPKEKVPDWSKPKSKADPFANPSPELLVTEIPRDKVSHVLVLNKFPVIPNHFIIATKANRPQTDLLEESDLSATYACIRTWEEASPEEENGRLFAFFNSGEHSGASQVHRHLQFLPNEDMLLGSEGNHGWQLLIRSMTSRAHPRLPLLYNPALPFVHYATKIETNTSPSSLYSKYLMLMKAALSATKSSSNTQQDYDIDDKVEIEKNGQTTFSYNLAITTDTMAICPRKCESALIPGLGDDHDVSINGTILGGTLMVKDETEWKTLRHDPHMLDCILEAIGYTRLPSSPERVGNRL